MKMFLVVALILMLGSACGRRSAVGFHLPDGDVAKGKVAFVDFKCFSCHKVDGVELPPPIRTKPEPILIGGPVSQVKTYGELVTSIINPSHIISPDMQKEWITDEKLSPMPDFNRTMTVQQMIDLVSFLQSRYKELQPLYYYR